MTNDTSAADRQPTAGAPGPSYAPPAPTTAPAEPPTAETQAPNGDATSQPSSSPYASGPISPYGGPASTPQVSQADLDAQLPTENVLKGAGLALLALVLGAVVSGIIWKLGYVASISSLLVGIAAVALYRRGSGGRVRKGIPVVVGIVLLGIVVNFFTAVAVDLYGYYPQLDADVAASYPTRWGFVTDNLFYGPVLAEYTKDLVLFVLFGLLGGFFALVRVMRARTR